MMLSSGKLNNLKPVGKGGKALGGSCNQVN
jgi:hypothetical protein